MSNNAAIAAVTASLTNMIQAAVAADPTVSSGTVTARPPDRARLGAPVNQINLFLYRTSIDAAWRNQDPPAIRPGEIGQPPLPLVLSYLITAYGEDDDEILAHRLLGIAMGVLNDRPVLSRAQIASALPPPGSDLQNQVERVRITPDPRPQDEISRMWTTFNTGYRLSVSYDAAVVLIDSTRPVVAAPPVLTRGAQDTGPAAAGTLYPQLQMAVPPNQQPAAQPGDVLTLTGSYLSAISAVQITHPLAAQPLELTPLTLTASQVTVQLPDPPQLPAGIVTVAATFGALMDEGHGRPAGDAHDQRRSGGARPQAGQRRPADRRARPERPDHGDGELLPRGPAAADDRTDRRFAAGVRGPAGGGEQPAELWPAGLHRRHLPAARADRLGGQHPGRQPSPRRRNPGAAAVEAV